MGCTGCAREPQAFPLDIETIRQLNATNTAAISYEVAHDAVLVTVIDKYRDAHIHRLTLGDMPQAQAIELLKQKQAELGQHDESR